ncbi:hypothetical protein [Candidatus Paracaedibacter symbiosus]|uniref:hypothetical protein n=1 Tax=Candidatus Paracaedibacter symbiosus TaxID=244582 RepID=UPI000509CAE6|nr:hypothetical protein [Candidatus Paracaedibacter symbiosus]
MFKSLLFLSQFFTCEAHHNHRIYDILIQNDQEAIPAYKSNIYFNDDLMTVKEIKVIIHRNEKIAAKVEQMHMYREGHEMNDSEILGIRDPGSRSITVKVSSLQENR